MGLIRSKALFMSIILVCAIFSISLIAPEVEAQQQVCCEKTKSGDYCQMGSASQCDGNFNQASVSSCDQAAFCKPVCCIDNADGTCYANTPFSTCFNGDDTTYEANVPSCDARVLPACRLGCCNLGGSYSLRTEQQCNLEVQNNPDYFAGSEYFYPGITNELDCSKLGQSEVEGCCIESAGNCAFGPSNQCSTKSATIKENGDPGFYRGAYCSDNELQSTCGCTPHKTKGCVEGSDDVYWFDSCGNREEIAEDCDLDSDLTICGLNNAGNDYICKTANCENPVYYPTSPNTDVPIRKHSESWCVYEAGVGDFKDRPGTKHYRATCSNGIESIEECRDFREEICVESTVPSADLGDFKESQCLYNDIYNSPIDERVSTVPLGFKFYNRASTHSPNRVGTEVCREGNIQGTVWYTKSHSGDDWHCRGNCQLETQGFIDQAASYCKSLGDCGADTNILGKRTTEGFQVVWTGSARGPRPTSISEPQWKIWEKYGIFGGIKSLEEVATNNKLDDSGITRAEQISTEYAAYTALSGIILGASIYYGVGALVTIWLTSAVSAAAITAAAAGTSAAATAAAISAASTLSTVSTIAAWVPVIGWLVAIVALIVAGVLYAVYSGANVRGKVVNVYCAPWQAPSGGNDCGACNDDPLGCTEYKCKSLGQACELINTGTEAQKCVDQHPNDVNSPIISTYDEILTESYSSFALPNGYEIQPSIKPFTRIKFGFKTNEPAQCKVDTKHTDSIDEMPHFFGNTPMYLEEHENSLSLPNGKDYTYYIRCKDAKGNANQAEYAIKVKTDVGPDFTPPVIETTSIENSASIGSDSEKTPLSIYLNEPATCKWDFNDKDFNSMDKLFACNTEIYEDQTFYNTYECATILEPVTLGKDSNFYFKCKDNSGNINKESHKFTLRRSNPLIAEVTTDPLLTGQDLTANQFTIKVATSGGSQDGNANCRFTTARAEYEGMVDFLNTGGTQHSQPLSMTEGRYNIDIICRDDALNQAVERLQFNLALDRTPPKLTHVYKQAGNVFVEINENAKCEYSTEEFVFGQGNSLSTTMGKSFTIQEPADEYWVACEDKFGNIMDSFHIVP